jgi:hypothetical protein
MNNDFGLWRSLVARCVRDAEAPGSNPGSPTSLKLSDQLKVNCEGP